MSKEKEIVRHAKDAARDLFDAISLTPRFAGRKAIAQSATELLKELNEPTDYNGWLNYETWAVNNWLRLDGETQTHFQQIADCFYSRAQPTDCFTKTEQATLDFAEWLKSFYSGELDRIFDRYRPSTPNAGFTDKPRDNGHSSVWADLFNPTLQEVCWHEIAGKFIEQSEGGAA